MENWIMADGNKVGAVLSKESRSSSTVVSNAENTSRIQALNPRSPYRRASSTTTHSIAVSLWALNAGDAKIANVVPIVQWDIRSLVWSALRGMRLETGAIHRNTVLSDTESALVILTEIF